MPSSVIHGMVYWPQRETLDIVFRGDRGSYRYFEVSAEEWRAFKRAASKGTYLNSVFKAGHLRFKRLRAVPAEFATALSAGAGGGLRDLPDENIWGFYEGTS